MARELITVRITPLHFEMLGEICEQLHVNRSKLVDHFVGLGIKSFNEGTVTRETVFAKEFGLTRAKYDPHAIVPYLHDPFADSTPPAPSRVQPTEQTGDDTPQLS